MKDPAVLDAQDALGYLRERFQLPDNTVYLDGNSLGVLPSTVPARLEQVLREEWGRDLIRSRNRHDWIGMPMRASFSMPALIPRERTQPRKATVPIKKSRATHQAWEEPS